MPTACNLEGPSPAGAPTLLVVDDLPDVVLVLGKLLEAFGYRVVACHSARDVLAVLAQRDDIALVISDVRMPGLDGFELVRQMRARFPSVPMLLMSGMASAGDDIGPHGVAVLPKPIDPATLERVVKGMLAPTT